MPNCQPVILPNGHWHCPVCGFDSKRPHVPGMPLDRIGRECRPPVPPPPVFGPGTELTKMLAALGFTYTPGCKCKQRAEYMDRMGCDWCEANIDTIVGWLREEADRRKLPFVPLAAKLLVKRAIRKARATQARSSG